MKIPTYLFNDSKCRDYSVENEVCSMADKEERCLRANIWIKILLNIYLGMQKRIRRIIVYPYDERWHFYSTANKCI